jgi:Secretion system C-terminal sorting domain
MKNFTNQNSSQNVTKQYRTCTFFGRVKRYEIILSMLAAFAFHPDPTHAQFVQQGSKLIGTGAVGTFSDQGSSVSISSDGNTAIVGGPGDNNSKGAAWIFTRAGGVWSQHGSKLVGKGAVGSYGPYQGGSVAISSDGNTAIIGGVGDNNFAGAAWIFIRTGVVWTQQGSKLVSTGAIGNADQGESVSISGDGNTAAVGGYDDHGGIGAVWVYTRTAGVWTQQGKLVGTGNVGQGAGQGRSVSISSDGNTIITGGPGYGGEYNTIGAAWVFSRTGSVWTQQSKLVGSGAVNTHGTYQGISVSLSSDGNTAIVGGWKDNNGIGAAWVFTRSGGIWTQQGSKLTGTGAIGLGTRQGWSVSISGDGNKAIVGGSGDNNGIGAAWVYSRTGGVWTQQGNKLTGTGVVGSPNQGDAVSISSNDSTAIVGGPGDNSSAGAVWVYTTGKAPGVTQINPELKNIIGETIPVLMIYPNPAKDNLTVEFTGSSEGNVKVNVYNLSGQKVMNIENSSVKGLNTFGLNTSKLGTGVYIIEIENNGQKQYQQFLISR